MSGAIARNRKSGLPILLSLVLAVALLPGLTYSAGAQEETAFKTIGTAPQQLESGSPSLFRVEIAGAPSALVGKWLGRDLVFFKHENAWYALGGVDVETGPGAYDLVLDATMPNGKIERTARSMTIHAASYKTVNLNVAQNFVEPDAATMKEIAADKEVKDAAFASSSPLPQWSGAFRAPVHAAAKDSFGTRRTFNGKLASIHRGMDYRAATGTPVYASNAGTIILARKLFYEGNCVAVDHGQGFQTIYMHLSKIEAKEGQKVIKGRRLGLSGATGRATGPHLHFAARWRNSYVDPAKLLALPLQPLP